MTWNWTQIVPEPGSLGPRALYAMVYNPDAKVVFAYGGFPYSQDLSPFETQVWMYDPAIGAWLQYGSMPGNSGDRWAYASMAYDAANHHMILVGGEKTRSGFRKTSEWANDTWVDFSSKAGTCPADSVGRTEPMIAYDASQGQVVMWGVGDGTLLWVWHYGPIENGSPTGYWVAETPVTSPPARLHGAMIYDPIRQKIVLFGGRSTDGFDLNDTWEWDGSVRNWSHIATATSPDARSFHSMGYLMIEGRVVLFGGEQNHPTDGLVLYGDTWFYDGTDWQTEGTPLRIPVNGKGSYTEEQQKAARSRMIVASIPPRDLMFYGGVSAFEVPAATDVETIDIPYDGDGELATVSMSKPGCYSKYYRLNWVADGPIQVELSSDWFRGRLRLTAGNNTVEESLLLSDYEKNLLGGLWLCLGKLYRNDGTAWKLDERGSAFLTSYTPGATGMYADPSGDLFIAARDPATYEGSVVRYDAAADSWSRTAIPNNGCSDTSIHGSSNSDVWVVGGSCYHFDGTAWTSVSLPFVLPCWYNGVYDAGPNNVWISGRSGSDTDVWHFDGSSWTRAGLPSPDVSGLRLFGISATDVWAYPLVASNGDAIYHWNGLAWTPVFEFSMMVSSPFLMMWGSAADGVWLYVSFPGSAYGQPPAPSGVFKWNGSSWTEIAPLINNYETAFGGWSYHPNKILVTGYDTLWCWNGTAWHEVSSGLPEYISTYNGTSMSHSPPIVEPADQTTILEGGNGYLACLRSFPSQDLPAGNYVLEVSTAYPFLSPEEIGGAEFHLRVSPPPGIDLDYPFLNPDENPYGDDPLIPVLELDTLAIKRPPTAYGHDNIIAVGDRTIVRSNYPAHVPTIERANIYSCRASWAISSDNIYFLSYGTGNPVWHWNGTSFYPIVLPPDCQDVYGISIWAASADAVFIGGYNAILYWDGTIWRKYAVAIGNVQGLWGFGATDVYACGGNTVWHWNGIAWSIHTATIAPPGYGGSLFTAEAIWGTSDSDLYVTGYGIPYYYSGMTYKWNGSSWSLWINHGGDGVRDYFGYSIHGLSSSDVWIGCGDGKIIHWNGSSFNTWNLPYEYLWDYTYNIINYGNIFYAIHDISPTNVVAAGARGNFYRYDGTNWTRYCLTTSDLYSIAHDSSTGDIWVGGDNSSVLKRTSGGTWSSPFTAWFKYTGDLFGFSSSEVYAAIGSGVLKWDGASWQPMPFTGTEVRPMYPISRIWGANNTDMWAVGDYAAAWHWDGTSWTEHSPIGGSSVLPLQKSLRALHGTATNNVICAGDNGRRFKWNGSAWSQIPEPTTTSSGAIWGISATEIYAGYNGTNSTSGLWKWNGTAWRQIYDSPIIIFGIWGTSGSDLWIGGYPYTGGGYTLRHWNGTAWTVYSTGIAVRCLRGNSTNDIWAAGFGSASNTPLSHWNGTAWTDWPVVSALVNQTFRDMWCVASNSVWAVGLHGSGGTNYVWKWDGTSWNPITNPPGVSLYYGLYSVWASSDNDVYVGGPAGYLAHWNGSSWTQLTVGFSYSISDLWGCYVGGALRLYMAMGSYLSVYDGTHVINDLWLENATAVWGIDSDNVMGTGASTTSEYAGEYSGYYGGGGNIVTGSIYNMETITGTWFASANKGWMVGTNGRIDTWDGYLWGADPLAPTTSVELNDVRGTDQSTVYAVGWTHTVFHWNGTSWADVSPVLPPVDPYGLEFNRVWVFGTNDIAVTSSIARAFRCSGGNWSQIHFYGLADATGLWATSSSNIFVICGGYAYLLNPPALSFVGDTHAPGPDSWYAVHGSDPANLVAVGNNGRITYYSGGSWHDFPPLPIHWPLRGIWVFSPTNFYTVGDQLEDHTNNIWHWDGSSLTQISLPGTTSNLKGIFATSTSNIWVVGDAGHVFYWDGATWTDISIDDSTECNTVWASSPSDVWVGAYSGSIMHYNGSAWAARTPPGSPYEISSIRGTSPTSVYATSGYWGAPYVWMWDGSSWTTTDFGQSGYYGFGALGGHVNGSFYVLGGDRNFRQAYEDRFALDMGTYSPLYGAVTFQAAPDDLVPCSAKWINIANPDVVTLRADWTVSGGKAWLYVTKGPDGYGPVVAEGKFNGISARVNAILDEPGFYTLECTTKYGADIGDGYANAIVFDGSVNGLPAGFNIIHVDGGAATITAGSPSYYLFHLENPATVRIFLAPVSGVYAEISLYYGTAGTGTAITGTAITYGVPAQITEDLDAGWYTITVNNDFASPGNTYELVVSTT